MITFLLKLFIIIYLIYMIKNIYDMINYNKQASLYTIDNPNKDKVDSKLDSKSPLLLETTFPDVTIQSLDLQIPGYIIKEEATLLSLHQLSLSDTIHIHKNKQLIHDFEFTNHMNQLFDYITNVFNCSKEYSMSIYRGKTTTELYKNYRERFLLTCVQGSPIIYIFNPKHENDIKGLDTTLIKKWGIKIQLHQGKSLYLPPEWYYFTESNNDCILSYMECDSYSTFLYNYLRNK